MIVHSATAHSPHSQETRCESGQLIAKLRSDGVELKCKRCKRIVLIPYTSVAEVELNIRACTEKKRGGPKESPMIGSPIEDHESPYLINGRNER